MTLETLFEKIRAMYVDALLKAVRDARERRTDVELLIHGEDVEAPLEGVLGGGVRLDLVVATPRGYEEQRIGSISQLGFDPITVPWPGDAELRIEPFVWDCTVVEADVPKKKLLAGVRAWLDAWMAPAKEREVEEGLLGVVHFCAEPREAGGVTTLSLDLGSAPVKALFDLLELVADAGATSMRLSEAPSAAAPAPAKKKSTTKKKNTKKAAPAKAQSGAKRTAKKSASRPSAKKSAPKKPSATKRLAKQGAKKTAAKKKGR